MASPNIQPGLKGQRQTLVCEHNVAPHVDKFSTPSMIRLMEQASSEAVAQYLEEGQVTVGFEVNVRHLAPADIGATIIAYAEVTEIDRNRVTFKVEAYEGERKIGEGTHRRAIITPGGS
jgi:predicted thioesterase